MNIFSKNKGSDDPSVKSNNSGQSSKKRRKKKKKKNRDRADSDDGSFDLYGKGGSNGNPPHKIYAQDDNSRGRAKTTLGGLFKRKTRSVSPRGSPKESLMHEQSPAAAKGVSFDINTNDFGASNYNPADKLYGNGSSAAAPAAPSGGASPYANAYSRPDRNPKRGGKGNDDDDEAQPEVKRGGQSLIADGKKERVRPYRCYNGPVYMTESELYKDMMKPSTNVVFLRSYYPPSTAKKKTFRISDRVRKMYGTPDEDGRIGSLRAEVLGCVGLARNKPFTAVYLVSGDNAFCTDVLNNFRSPMWPSVSTRAAVFPVHHAYAQLYCGVFDVRARKGKDNDVFCGRVIIDLATLRPNTEYDVTFPIRASSFIYDRRPRGVLRLRFSVHYFSERFAVMSYLKTPKWATSSAAKEIKQPTIPCAEPKTFRNVAVTLHGQDFPGKYTRASFRATMREFNLYQQNLRFMSKMIIMDAVFYENPLFSVYLLVVSLYSVYMNSVRMVPVYFMGYILLLFLDNYAHITLDQETNLGYQPLTIKEVFQAVVFDGGAGAKKSYLEPLLVKKRAQRSDFKAKHSSQQEASYYDMLGANYWMGGKADNTKKQRDSQSGEIQLRDHREFPFSEKSEYKKFAVQDAIAPSANKTTQGKEGNQRLAGRLSIYFVEENKSPEPEEKEEDDDVTDSSTEESDEKTVGTSGDALLGDDDWIESSDEDKDDSDDEGGGGKRQMDAAAALKKSVLVGPPQNADVSTSKRVPPHVHLKKIEANLHKVSKKVSVEKIMTQPFSSMPSHEAKMNQAESDIMGMKKQYWDEFDRALGLYSRNPNPVLRITSTFLGPLMRIIRIFIYVVRIGFNVSTWRDPYISFWVFVYMTSYTIFLYLFPWRTFFFIASIMCFGPQNVFVRKYLEKKAAAKAEEKKRKEKEEAEKKAQIESGVPQEGYGFTQYGTGQYKQMDASMNQYGGANNAGPDAAPKKQKKGFFSKFIKNKKGDAETNDTGMAGMLTSDQQAYNEQLQNQLKRPAFSTQHNARTTKKGLLPREAVVPYSKFRKERFYDWPPDPTVSRATPVPLSEKQEIELKEKQNTGASAKERPPQPPPPTQSHAAPAQAPVESVQAPAEHHPGRRQSHAPPEQPKPMGNIAFSLDNVKPEDLGYGDNNAGFSFDTQSAPGGVAAQELGYDNYEAADSNGGIVFHDEPEPAPIPAPSADNDAAAQRDRLNELRKRYASQRDE